MNSGNLDEKISGTLRAPQEVCKRSMMKLDARGFGIGIRGRRNGDEGMKTTQRPVRVARLQFQKLVKYLRQTLRFQRASPSRRIGIRALDESDKVPKDIEGAFWVLASREDLGVEFVEVTEHVRMIPLRDVEDDLELLGRFTFWVVDELEYSGCVNELARTPAYNFLDREVIWPGFRDGTHRVGVNGVIVDLVEPASQNDAKILFRILSIVEVYRPTFVSILKRIELSDDARFWSAGNDEAEWETRLL